MKRLLIAILMVALFVGEAFAGAATVTKTEYGYEITGDTGATLIPQDTWVTATAYIVGQKVVKTGIIYTCAVAHTSGTFATDLAAKDWTTGPYCTMYITSILFFPNTSTDVAAFTSGSTDVSCLKMTNTFEQAIWPSPGAEFINMKVTLTAASDIVYVFVNGQNF